MKHLFPKTFALFLIILGSCNENKEGSLTLRIKPEYDGQPLKTFNTLPFGNGEQLQFTHLSLLISDLRLIDQSSEKILFDFELVDLSFDNQQAAEEGIVYEIFYNPDTYDGIRFGIGVPPDINQKVPADFPSTSPLSKTGYYWVAWTSYIFLKIEGRLDSLGTGNFDTGFAFHTGSDDLFRTIEFLLPIKIEDGKDTPLEMVIDYKKLLEGVDIKSNPQNHTPADTVLISKIVNNLASSISLIQ